MVPGASAGASPRAQAPPTTADSLLANSTMPQPSTPSRVAMRREASTKTSAGAMPDGHGGGQLAHHGVLLGDARQQHAADDDHEAERAEDEHRAERVRRDALGARVGVVEQRQLVGGDGADHAEGGEAARQEAGGVDDHEDRDLLDGRVEAARGVDRRAPCSRAPASVPAGSTHAGSVRQSRTKMLSRP